MSLVPAREALRWLDERRTAWVGVAALRRFLPGDERFGDPLSTSGIDPARLVARRAWSVPDRRWSLARELGLAVLQVAEWLGPRPQGESGPIVIAFTDLVEFSSWALRAGDASSLEPLRTVDAEVTACFEAHGGLVVKRLGDGTMAAFDDAQAAAAACERAIERVRGIEAPGYRPELRASLHLGRPHAIGTDCIGVDVNIAARLCDAARPR